MSDGNKTHISELICLQVNPNKLSDRKIVQIFDRLVRKGKVPSKQAGLTNTADKTWFIKSNYNFVEVILARGELGAFIKLFKLDLNDFKNVRGGNTADIKAIENLKQSKLLNKQSDFKHFAMIKIASFVANKKAFFFSSGF